jgi:PAS domain S-box-containing protein
MTQILIADDNDDNLYYLQALLGANGYEVVTARNGSEALKLALAAPPHLMISDILMPVMDGFTLCKRWRTETQLSKIPFVFYTATYTDAKDRELGLSIGADDFLTKPLEPEALLKVVHGLLLQKETGTLPDRTSAASTGDVFLRDYNAALIRKLEDKLMELEKANRGLSDTKEFLQAVLGNSPLPIIAMDGAGKVTMANPAFCAAFGYSNSEVLGRTCSETITPPSLEDECSLVAKRRSRENKSPYNTQRRRKDGTILDTEIYLCPLRVHDEFVGTLAIYRDITQQKRLEEQLWQAQKLEAIGQLAAGVAHDFNNLLAIMVGYSELIREGAEPQSPLFRQVDQICQACSRATSLTGRLLAFSRRQTLLPTLMDLRVFLEELEKTLRRITREDIELELNIGQQSCQILADPVQIEQVVLNLATNACYAMPNGGRLSLDLSTVNVDEDYARSHSPLRPVAYAKLTVSDTGIGMDEATMKRIFEPFFTTKPVGEGTGLGLSSAHGIVEQSGGMIFVSSQPGKGTSFEIYLPRTQAALASSSEPPESQTTGGSETILVVEDNESVRALLCEMLASLGYRVLPTASSSDALHTLQDTQEWIDLLITDVIMPQMNGRELSELAWSARPELRVLYVSGYDADLIQRQGVPLRRGGFLPKPFSRMQLAAAVRTLLDE